jgi:hypothetical protein
MWRRKVESVEEVCRSTAKRAHSEEIERERRRRRRRRLRRRRNEKVETILMVKENGKKKEERKKCPVRTNQKKNKKRKKSHPLPHTKTNPSTLQACVNVIDCARIQPW